MTPELFGLRGGVDYGLNEFREDVRRALMLKFGSNGCVPGDKTFNIKENSYRLDADVTPFLIYRKYACTLDKSGKWEFQTGVETRPRSNPSKRIINWHAQHYENGVARNTETRRRFKRIVRIVKRMKNEMQSSSVREVRASAAPIPSFLIECLVYNAPDNCFNIVEGSYYEDVRATVNYLWNQVKEVSSASSMREVNELKPLFGSHQPWSREQAQEFLLRAWQYIQFS